MVKTEQAHVRFSIQNRKSKIQNYYHPPPPPPPPPPPDDPPLEPLPEREPGVVEDEAMALENPLASDVANAVAPSVRQVLPPYHG